MPDLASCSSMGDEWSDAGYLLDLLTRPAWHASAACPDAPVEMSWFPDRGAPAKAAQAVCAGCSVLDACGKWAATQGSDLSGIWGGVLMGRRHR